MRASVFWVTGRAPPRPKIADTNNTSGGRNGRHFAIRACCDIEHFSGKQLNAGPGICREVDRDLISRALVSRFCEVWIRKTMRKVMMVMPVLMVSY